MGETILHHLLAHQFSSADLPHSETDQFLLEGAYTESNVSNSDGTKRWMGGIIAHGAREGVEARIEEMIKSGMISYRSSKRGADYFRSGVANALDSAEQPDGATSERIRIRIGHKAESSGTDRASGRSIVSEIIDDGPWERILDTKRIEASASATAEAMNGVVRVDALREREAAVPVFRNFEVTQSMRE